MPEGHTVHRIARQFQADFVRRTVALSSPQGRFAAGAALLDGSTMTASRAIGKQLFLAFGSPEDGPVTFPPVPDAGGGTLRWLRVHLGLYGAWDFHGQVSPLVEGAGVVGSMGAPRLSRAVRLHRAVRMGEGERALPTDPGADVDPQVSPEPDVVPEVFPPEPVGQVRVRLQTDRTVADLRGPTACEVLTPQDVATVVAKAGPDPQVDAGDEAQEEFVRRLTGRGTPVGVLLMDQSVVSGIGNIYRAEMLFRARLDPRTPGRRVPPDVARALWADWVDLLADGVRTGVMITRADLDAAGRARALVDRAERHAVYGRAGEPCLVCGGPIALEDMAARKLYWCPTCQR